MFLLHTYRNKKCGIFFLRFKVKLSRGNMFPKSRPPVSSFAYVDKRYSLILRQSFFLHSDIPDSSRANFYNNEISERVLNVSRNIASHRVEWSPTKNLELGFNETVIYATRELDIHYLVPVIIRLVSWDASHDIGHSGISRTVLEELINEIKKYSKIFLFD